jgi:hypothetical protein
VVDEMAIAYDTGDVYQAARFYSAGGTLDFSVWGLGIATTPNDVVSAVGAMWFQIPGRASVEAEHLFVTRDGALVWWYAYDNGGTQDWVQSYVFGQGGRSTSRAFRGLEVPYDSLDPVESQVLELYERFLDAVRLGSSDDLAGVYAIDAVVADQLRDAYHQGVGEIAASVAEAPGLERGPWPAGFVYQSGVHLEALVLVQRDGVCPGLEARRWVIAAGKIAHESILTHVPSAQRCGDQLPDGWWTTFELPPDLQDNVTEVLDVGGALVELVNAEPEQEAFARWMIGRFTEAGLRTPEMAAVWFPPASECDTRSGLAIESDDRYEGRQTVVVCSTAGRLVSSTAASGWSPTSMIWGLHELAHLWMLDHLDDDTRQEFVDLVGLDDWRSAEVPWDERGVEHAATTIAWGLGGPNDARYPIFPVPSCEELAVRYRLLTDREPLTTCGPDGWVS